MASLTDLNCAIHAHHESLLLDTYEACTELHWDNALTSLTNYREALEAHLQTEESIVIPTLQREKFRADKELTIKQIDGDHLILKRSLEKAFSLINALKEGDPSKARRDLVKYFDVLTRIRRVLEHHTMRESRDVYDFLENVLDERERIVIVESLKLTGGMSPEAT